MPATAGTVRVRFAPSPTGAIHVGNVRTALFNYLYARHHGGTFVLRLDDTDRRRNVAKSVKALYRDLRRLGLDWDEGPDVGGPHAPYVQSERTALYADQLTRLLVSGSTYRCYCSTERLKALKADQAARGEPPRYDRRCLALSERERAGLAGTPGVVRLRLPNEMVIWRDLVYGERSVDLRHVEDPILARSDGSMLYDLASVVDDHLMGITHILRGDAWLSTTPVHIALFRALGWEPPAFGHLPQIVGPDHKKLAKSAGSRSLASLLDAGYLPEALLNFLALQGWSPGGEEDVLAPDELVARFGLERVQRSPAVFDGARLDWLNGVHIRRLDPTDLADRCLPHLRTAGLVPAGELDPAARARLTHIVALSQDRLRLLGESPALLEFFFREPDLDRALLLERGPDAPEAAALLRAAGEALGATDFGGAALEGALRELAVARGCPTGRLFWLVRVAVTGRRAAPPLFGVLAALGRDVALARLERAAEALAMPVS
jgi:glutamyl-tRNA synthetase